MRILVALSLVLALPLAAAEPVAPVRPQADPSGGWCGTSPLTFEQLRRTRHRAQVERRRDLRADALSPMRAVNDIHIITADASMIPRGHPVDLEGFSIRYEPVDATSYRVSRLPLAYDANVGSPFEAGMSGVTVAYPLTHFAFPFYGETLETLHISGLFAIRGEARGVGAPTPRQYGPLELLTERGATIAPLVLPQAPFNGWGAIRETFVRETEEAVTVTWRHTLDPVYEYAAEMIEVADVQARLEASGAITFSYRELENLSWGGAIVSAGGEDWDAGRVEIATLEDAADDGEGPAEWRSITDIRSIELARVNDTDLLDIRIRFGASFTPSTVPGLGGIVQIELRDEQEQITGLSSWIDPSSFVTCLPSGECTSSETFVRFEGDTISVRVLQEQLIVEGPLDVVVHTWNASGKGDELAGTVTLATAPRTAQTDLSSLETPTTLVGPIIEGFTLPILEPYAVYDRLRQEYGLDDAEVDAVAIYQTFDTDIIFYAGAYSTVGNAGADNIILPPYDAGSELPRTPALLHMNHVLPLYPSDDPYFLNTLSHELGHRWLYFFTIDENGTSTRSLNPVSVHPAGFVHTPAAFQVAGPGESSTMGGGSFTQAGNTFHVGEIKSNGYSWHELYLMGLAEVEEVTPWFYIADADPALPLAYYPPPDTTVTGTRVDVSIDQVVRSMGPRYPTAELSQREFRTLFVLLETPSAPATERHIAWVDNLRQNFEPFFAKATGHRASTRASLPVIPSAAFTTSVTRSRVQFRDTSVDYPASWQWSFGDGTTSTLQHPWHSYAVSGTYTVTLTAANSRGSSTTTQTVDVVTGHRRATRH